MWYSKQASKQASNNTLEENVIKLIFYVFGVEDNSINRMVFRLCPNGVEWRDINTLIKNNIIKTITPSFKIKSNDYKLQGNYPIISQEIELISGYWNQEDKKLIENEYICFGDHSEHIKYISFQFVQGADGLKIIQVNDKTKILPKYFYYAICNFYQRHNNYERHFKYLLNIEIPIPPLPIQEKIVEILDTFDEYNNSMISGLKGEIEKNQKRYEYYRDTLLTFERKVV